MNNLLAYLNNYFEYSIESGDYLLSNGVFTAKGNYLVGQYIRIMGSVMSDGVYKITAVDGKTITVDKPLSGEMTAVTIVGMSVPQDIITLEAEIKDYVVKYAPNNIASESIPNFSITYNNNAPCWQAYFKTRLSNWFKPLMGKWYFLNYVTVKYE